MDFTEKLIEAEGREEKADDSGGGDVYLPLAINMRGIKCLVVGGGRIAARKVGTLVKSAAVITVVAPAVDESIAGTAAAGEIRWIEAKYDEQLMADYDFVIAATSDGDLNLAIGRQAEATGKLCCVVSSARHSRVIFPAAFEHDGITYALHSDGKQYRRTKQLRDELAEYVRKGDAEPG